VITDSPAFLARARHVLTCGPAGELRDGAVLVRAGRIAAVGPFDELRAGAPDVEVVGDGTGILVPGFVSGHGHFSEALVSGIGEQHTLWEWFEHVVGPIEGALTREMALVGTLLRGAEMALSGVTAVADMFCGGPGPEPITPGVVDALERIGLRGDVSFGAADRPVPRPLPVLLREHEALADAAARSRRSRFRVGLATVPESSDELVAATARLVAEHGGLHTHLHEVREEVTRSRTTRGSGSVEFAERAGLLDGRTLAAHCVWLSEADVDVLRRRDVAVVHNPVSNMILASGVCPVPRLRRDGITVALGLDGPASNDSQDMLETMKTAALLQKVHHLQADVISARDVVHMATIGGATALGLADEIGSLEPGKAADLVWLPERSPSLANIHDPYQKLVYCASVRDVARVWVEGEAVVVDGVVRGVDLAEVLPWSHDLAVQLATDAGLDSVLSGRGPAGPGA
jgi:5-methylthioadenosine/S-adenosylhomocysteine deaminase